jgi:ribosomal protein L29
MKKRELQDLKHRPLADLKRLLKEKEEALLKSNFDLSAGKLKKISVLKELKKDIARIKNFINILNNQ